MKSSLQERIAPPAPGNDRRINALPDKESAAATGKTTPENKVDFKSVLMNANDAVQKKREAANGDDLSGAKNYDEFLQNLSEKTQQLRVPKNSLGKEDFLRLFITQLQNQDPLKPKDGAEMASQLAQFNSVEQMMNVNKGLERLEKAQTSSQSIGFVNYIGKDVSIDGGRVRLNETGIGDVKFKVGHDVSEANLEVRDGGGQVVATKNLGTVPKGEHKLGWDGMNKEGQKLPGGTYTFSIKGTDLNGQDVPVEISTRVTITGVDMSSDKPEFFTSFGKLKSTDIAAIGESGFLNKKAEATPNKPTSVGAAASKNEQTPQPDSQLSSQMKPQLKQPATAASKPVSPYSNGQMPSQRQPVNPSQPSDQSNQMRPTGA